MKLSTKLLVSLTLIAVSISYSQTQKDTLVAFQYYKKGDSLLTARKFDESIVFFEKALPIYERAKDWKRVASCYNKLSKNLWKTKTLEKSLQNAKKALNVCDTHYLKNSLEAANAYYNISLYYFYNIDYSICLRYLHKSLLIYQKLLPEDHIRFFNSYSGIARMNQKMKKFKKAIFYYNKALKVSKKIHGLEHKKTIGIYGSIGGVYLDKEKYDVSIDYYNKYLDGAIKNGNHYDIANAYMFLAISNIQINRLTLGLEQCEKALSIFKKENKLKQIQQIYLNIGVLYLNKGEYNKSLQYLKKSSKIIKDNDVIINQNHLGEVYEYTGYLYFYQGDYENALSYVNKASHIYKKTFRENYYRLSYCYSLKANILKSKKQYDEALMYYNKSSKINQSIYGGNSLHMMRTYLSLGVFYQERKEFDSASKYYKKCLQILKNEDSETELWIYLYINYANMYAESQKLREALTFFNKAIEYNTKKEYIEVDKNNFDIKHYYRLDRLFYALSGKAKTFLKLYKRGKEIINLDKSISLYENLDQLIGSLQQSYQSNKDIIDLAKKVKEMYARAVEVNILKYRATKDSGYLEKIRYYSEKSKSNTLKKLLSDHQAKKISELPEEIISLENTLKSDKAYFQSRITSEQTKDSIDETIVSEYEDKLFDTNRKQDSLTKLLEKKYPNYYQLKYINKVISVSEIQEKLNINTTVLEFFTADSMTYAFTISKNKFSVKELQTPRLAKQIKSFREAAISKDITYYKQLGNSIYNTLIKPINEDLVGNELIIVPDGSLWHLNFDLLLTKEHAIEAPSKLPYLVRDYAITYANSATLHFNPFKEQQQNNQQKGVLAFSFSDSTNVVNTKNISLARLRDAAEDLPGTRKEIRAIADIIDGQYYFGEDSDEANFKKHASNYKILHLALHGDVDNERPQNSKLYFTKSNDTIEDSYLYGHELFALNIPSELTVLSACNTGTGKIAKGEGIMSLGHAFQYAGTKSLLLSSWEVPDETTPELMKYFYTNLKGGMSKSKALQQAKLQYLEQADIYKAAPFYWGGFYLVGDNTPIDFGMNSLWYWGIGLLVGLVFITIFSLYRKNKQIS